jgi:AhpD family alkylhydroperoxidase
MHVRMKNPAMLIPEVMEALLTIQKSIEKLDVSPRTVELVQLRASQINGCSYCVDMHSQSLKKSGESDERLFALPVWRNSPRFDAAERAALALAESVTKLAEGPDGVSDTVWAAAEEHYDRRGLSSLLLAISVTNVWNRLSVATTKVGAA